MKYSCRTTAISKIAIAIAVTALSTVACMPGHAQNGPGQNDLRLDKAARLAVVDSLTRTLNSAYVYPDKAAQLDAVLHANLKQGKFDAVTSAAAFADQLTELLQQETNDKHLMVRYFAEPIPPDAGGEDSSPEEKAEEFRDMQRFNFGIENVGRLRGNIGYIDVHEFDRPEYTADKIAATMNLLSDTAALIIDLRKTHGGDPECVMLFASYLFDKPTHLNDIYWREEDRTETRWTQATVAGKKYGETRKVYVLTSHETFSAGEDFAYAMKYAERATIIGETTGGGAHPGEPRRLTDHFMMFVPLGRAINPVTHGDWEGTGVVPNVAVAADKALEAAQVAALKDLIAAEKDPKWKGDLQYRLDKLLQVAVAD